MSHVYSPHRYTVCAVQLYSDRVANSLKKMCTITKNVKKIRVPPKTHHGLYRLVDVYFYKQEQGSPRRFVLKKARTDYIIL